MSRNGKSISESTIYKKLRGVSQFNAPEITAISKMLGFNENEMLEIFFVN